MKIEAWLGADTAFASPPAWSGKHPTALPPGLANHSLNANAVANGLKRFRATVTISNEPVAQTSSTSAIKDDIIMYYHNDHLGTPLFLTDEVGSIVWRREQKPFGETTYLRGDVTENLRFPGQYFDAETGLAQNWHRDYAAGLGRYVEADPIGFRGGANIYVYTLDNPVKFTDIKGMKVERCIDMSTFWKHALYCVNDRCWGFEPTNDHLGVLYSDGVVIEEQKNKKHFQCIEVPICEDKRKKFESCLISRGERGVAGDHPHYSFPVYTCVQWADDVVTDCYTKAVYK